MHYNVLLKPVNQKEAAAAEEAREEKKIAYQTHVHIGKIKMPINYDDVKITRNRNKYRSDR